MSTQDNIKKFARSATEDRAAVFAGAGISQDLGLPGWDGLASRFMKEIGLNEDVEKDPLRLAEYAELSSNDGRNRVYTCLAEELGQDKELENSKAIKILSEMPINTLWTTNFTIIERTYESQNIKLRALTVKKSLLERPDGDIALLYKMHGSIEKGATYSIVISRSDYDRFAQNKGGFQTMLQSDIISKYFLFVGLQLCGSQFTSYPHDYCGNRSG